MAPGGEKKLVIRVGLAFKYSLFVSGVSHVTDFAAARLHGRFRVFPLHASRKGASAGVAGLGVLVTGV